MLTFNLKKEWFEKIKSGEKTHEYRLQTKYWTKRLSNLFINHNVKRSFIIATETGTTVESKNSFFQLLAFCGLALELLEITSGKSSAFFVITCACSTIRQSEFS